MLIARLVAEQASGRICYWATFSDERGMSHYAFVVDPVYADLSPANAASRTKAVAALDRAVERYRATLASLRSAH
jgi:L-amino acid N-acyltransferase YncA